MKKRTRLSCILLTGSLLAAAGVGCSDDDSSSTANTGGSGAGATGGSGGIGGSSSSTGDLCTELENVLASCGEVSECGVALTADCADLVGVLSQEFAAGVGTCLSGGGGIGDCIGDTFSSLTPTQAHTDFAAAFCQECTGGVIPSCEETIFGGEGLPEELQLASSLMLPLGDDLVSEITEECARSNPLTCVGGFSSCVQQVLVERAIPSESAACLLQTLVSGDVSGGCATGAGGAGGAGGIGGGGNGFGGSAGMTAGGSSGAGGTNAAGAGGATAAGGVGGAAAGAAGSAGAPAGGTGGQATGGAGGSGGVSCDRAVANDCGTSTTRYCHEESLLCTDCPPGFNNCDGVGSCECDGACAGQQCSSCSDVYPEPNDTPASATPACGSSPCVVSDCDSDAGVIVGVVGTGDIDYHSFRGEDRALCSVEPFIWLDNSNVQACIFAACLDGPAVSFSCTNGTYATHAVAPGYEGCCTGSGGMASIDLNCPGVSDDADVLIEVRPADSCSAYVVDYHY